MMDQNSKDIKYDAIIIGGGPSGLTAAYFLANSGYKTILFERLPKKGILDHPCGSMICPIWKDITLERTSEGVYFKDVDFLFPNEMIIGSPGRREFTMPNGVKFGMNLEDPQEHLIFQLNKQKFLRALANRAEGAGANLVYGNTVSELIMKENSVSGVKVGDEVFRSSLVLSGEGLSRRFSQQAGLYESEEPHGYIMIYSVYVKNLNLTDEQLGQVAYFGGKASPVPRSSVTFHSYGKNKGIIFISVLLDEYEWSHEEPVEKYLNEAVEKIVYLKELTDQGKFYKRDACWIKLATPSRLVSDGFIAMGDSVAPLGHTSNLIAMLTGRKAAETAIECLSTKDCSLSMLTSYNKLLESDLFQGVKFEGHLISRLLGFSDEQLNTIGNVLEEADLSPFFIGSKWDRLKTSLKLLFNWNAIKNRKLVRKLLG